MKVKLNSCESKEQGQEEKESFSKRGEHCGEQLKAKVLFKMKAMVNWFMKVKVNPLVSKEQGHKEIEDLDGFHQESEIILRVFMTKIIDGTRMVCKT